VVIFLMTKIADEWRIRMNAREIILSVLTKKDLFYLKGRYTKMNKIARKNGIAVDEKEDFIYTVMSLSGFCASSIGMISTIAFVFLVCSLFENDGLKAFYIYWVIFIFVMTICLYQAKKNLSFSFNLCLKMILMKYKFIYHRVKIPGTLPEIWIIYIYR
jgi:hypothetical protein